VLFLRSLLFAIGIWIAAIIGGIISPFLLPLPPKKRYAVLTLWATFVVWWLDKTCSLNFQVEGRENIPSGAAVVLSKHQSAWETIAFQRIFPWQIWILKRELLWLPLFGWALASLQVIAIDRGNPRRALQQILQQGKAKLQQGCWVIIFPEGTRVSPGSRKRYGIGGAMLAEQAGCPVLPVAHNAGVFWPRNAFIKRPGTIRVCIGPVIDPNRKTAAEINALAEQWIEETMLKLDNPPLQTDTSA
jgi:1-acyl-sn-glycerol-3-phosphate acyltransferase